MYKRLLILFPLFALVLLTLACNDGATPGETPTSKPTEILTQQPSPTDIEETATVDQTPTIEPTAFTPAASPVLSGTPAIAPADLSLYENVAVDQEECSFDPRTALANCLGRGLYSIDPPLTGEDISCSILIVEELPAVLLCRSQEPQNAVYYAINVAP